MTTQPRPRSLTLTASATEAATVDTQARQITGMAVPYGPVGYSSMGAVTFAKGAIRTPDQLGRVKLLRQHDPDTVLGYASAITEGDAGLFGTFEVPASELGDTALAEAADGRRDGLSVGVRLDEDVMEQLVDKWMNGDTSPTAATGELAEVSQVSLPAFADARIDGSAALAAALTGDAVLALTFAAPTAPAAAVAPGPQKEDTMTNAAPVAASAAELTPAAPAPAAAPPLPAITPTVVSSEPPVYTFDGSGPSLLRDAYRMKVDSDQEATARFSQFNQRMAAGDAVQGSLLVAAVETRATAPNFINQGYRPEMLLNAIDRGRPIVSRIGTVGLTDATPFRVPVESSDLYKGATVADGVTTVNTTNISSATIAFTAADVGRTITSTNLPAGTTITKVTSATAAVVSQKATATGSSLTFVLQRAAVGDHTEGTAHVAEGDLDIGEQLFTPGAISGAYRLSRELIDASNPALDSIALRAMSRDYAAQTEAKTAAALLAAAGTPVATINTVLKLRQELNNFFDVTAEAPEYVFSSTSYYTTLLGDVDSTGRPHLANINPVNAAGSVKPGWTGAYIDSAELVKSTRVGGDVAYITNPDDVLIGESSTQTFRFEEVEGPGVVKLAIWGYFGAKVLRTASVRAVTSA